MGILFNDSLIYLAGNFGETAKGLAISALCGNFQAEFALYDFLEDNGMDFNFGYKVGSKYLFHTVTLYFIGEVKEIGFGYLKLKNCSWVHWTGRVSELVKKLDFEKVTNRRPRTEYIGDYTLRMQSIIGEVERNWILPKDSIQ